MCTTTNCFCFFKMVNKFSENIIYVTINISNKFYYLNGQSDFLLNHFLYLEVHFNEINTVFFPRGMMRDLFKPCMNTLVYLHCIKVH